MAFVCTIDFPIGINAQKNRHRNDKMGTAFRQITTRFDFDEDNPNVIDISENENCNKNLIQDDAGSS